MRPRRKKNLIPRLEACAPLIPADPRALRGRVRAELAGGRPVFLEIGCGKGAFIERLAQTNPDRFFLAMEREPHVAVMAVERCMRAGLKNVRFIIGDAALLPEMLADGECDGIYINFCDPWPGKKRAKRRLTHGSMLRVYAALLAPGAPLRFKTDNRGLFDFSVEEFRGSGFELSDVTYDLHAREPADNIRTEYEQSFAARGLPIMACTAVYKGK